MLRKPTFRAFHFFYFFLETLETVEPLLPGLENESTLGAELLETEEIQVARYSGKIVEKNRERVQQIIGARAMGFPLRQVCAAFKVSPHTVAEIERRHSVKLATLKDRLARKFGVFVELGLDRAIQEVDRMDIDKLLVNLGIASDKLLVLNGDPSVIVGSTSDGPRRFSIESLNARLARAQNVTGSDAGDPAQTRASLEAPIDLEPAAADAALGGSDNQSPGNHS